MMMLMGVKKNWGVGGERERRKDDDGDKVRVKIGWDDDDGCYV